MARRNLITIQIVPSATLVALMLGALFYSSAVSAISAGGLEVATNQQRAEHGLGPLTDDGRLDRAAANKAADMIANNYWAHTSPSGVTPWYWFGSAGYPFTVAGENLASGLLSDTAVVSAWMNSAGHRDNILNAAYSNIGCGMASGTFQGRQDTVTVCMYGATTQTAPREAVTPAPSPTAAVRRSAPVAHTPEVTPTPAQSSAPVIATPQPSPIPLKVPAPSEPRAADRPARQTITPSSPETKPSVVAMLAAALRTMVIPWVHLVEPVEAL